MHLELFVVVEREDGALLLLQVPEGAAQLVLLGLGGEHVLDRGGVVVQRRFPVGVRRLAVVLGRPLERHADAGLEIGLPAPERELVDAELRGELVVVGLAAELRVQRVARGGDVAGATADRARDVVEPAQLVEDRAADARHRERAEREAARVIEGLDRLDEAERAGADELVEVHLGGEGTRKLLRDVMHEAHVLPDERIAGFEVARGERGPKVGRRVHASAPVCAEEARADQRAPAAVMRAVSATASARERPAPNATGSVGSIGMAGAKCS